MEVRCRQLRKDFDDMPDNRMLIHHKLDAYDQNLKQANLELFEFKGRLDKAELMIESNITHIRRIDDDRILKFREERLDQLQQQSSDF